MPSGSSVHAIWLKVRGRLDPENTYGVQDLLDLCRKEHRHFGFSTLSQYLAHDRKTQAMFRVHKNAYRRGAVAPAVHEIQRSPLLFLPIPGSPGLNQTEEALTLLIRGQAELGMKLDEILLRLRAGAA